MGVAGYALFGTAVDLHRPISSVLQQDVWLVVMNAGIFVHCIIAYVSGWQRSPPCLGGKKGGGAGGVAGASRECRLLMFGRL